MGQGASQPARRDGEREREREGEIERGAGGSGNSRRSILRQTTRHSTVDHADYEDNHYHHHDNNAVPTGGGGERDREDGGREDGWLLQGQHQQQQQQQQQQSQARPRRRPHSRASSINRLSQLLRQSTPDASVRPSTRDVTNTQAHAAVNSGSDSHPHAGPSESSRRVNLQRTASRLRNALSVRRSSPARDHRPSPLPFNLLHPRFSSTRPGMNRDSGADHYSPPRLPSIDISSTFDHEPFTPPDEEPDRQPRSSHSNRRSNSRLNALRPDRPFRHLTSSLRRRRSPERSVRRSGNEDQAAMLSRLLSVAAAATAATLMGDDHQALSEARSLTGSTMGDVGSGGEDGSFDGFLRALQNGRIASALRQGADGESDASREGPLNFFRMFRFGASGNPTTPLNTGPGDSSEAGDSNSEGRMVPIIIVGIRSINPNSSSGSGSAADDMPPFIDALGNFPSPLSATPLGANGHDSIDSILRPPQNGTSFRHRRRASMGGFGMGRNRISDRLDDQRDHRSPDRRRPRPWSMASTASSPEPRPPPATPASPSPELSRISSRDSTPAQSRPASWVRDFSAESRLNSQTNRSGANPLSSHTEETASVHSAHSSTNLMSSGDESQPFRHSHRRSDTVPNIHYPRFASGHPRRNGVVEPDNLPSLSRSSTSNATDSSSSPNNGNEGANSSGTANDSRSWIIYVLGGSYPENHPILTTPSLFTENPTYEDMMLLSALLGPAKAPVASEEDVEQAGGLYTVEENTAAQADASKTAELVAVAAEGGERVDIEAGQRCLVCLCEYNTKEITRKLVKCNHLFHQDCIDQWLTQGRNSCPLCRGEGVHEKEKQSTDEPAAAGSPSNPAELDASSAA
ncbi:hypothetical protein KC360_g2350 [Hortaea werneckii]|nr:hypothetical protein KC325_g2668 [Hortaea werneckii]KAI7000501.1 hypothetical protein KC359_g1174 [Hortaea werneckii]KAI7147872.1 hypothetical protein KC344_g2387 [Hortaea werneckii]KAI7177401.1 hypothetical protein KC360_g2350 [Hortaea werneckii]